MIERTRAYLDEISKCIEEATDSYGSLIFSEINQVTAFNLT
jgi:hypothetical protein